MPGGNQGEFWIADQRDGIMVNVGGAVWLK
jgi:hypothetical protein